MIGYIFCTLAFLSCWITARYKPARGLSVVIAVGYLYGIVRANVLGSSYFMFDAAVAGFYLGYSWQAASSVDKRRSRPVMLWLAVLIIWPLLIGMIPFQTPLVTLVGLRGNIFFLPFLLVGARLRAGDLRALGYGLAILNLGALLAAGFEYVLGVRAFYPQNAVTAIIYNSNDVAGSQFLRIPATFVTAHAFGGAMAATLPFIFGSWGLPGSKGSLRFLSLFGIVAAAVGILVSATRVNFVELVALVLTAVFFVKMSRRSRFLLLTAICVVALVSLGNDRMNRFKNLADTDAIGHRINGSVNRGFFEILTEYPLGNGLGGGGTSIPEFLASQVRKPISLESEYARILLEQGAFGLLLWITFIGWFISRGRLRQPGIWQAGRRLAFVACCSSLVIGIIGVGLLTSIPQTVLFLLAIGWSSTRAASDEAGVSSTRISAGNAAAMSRVPSYQLSTT